VGMGSRGAAVAAHTGASGSPEAAKGAPADKTPALA
jgi:hypothetical protein